MLNFRCFCQNTTKATKIASVFSLCINVLNISMQLVCHDSENSSTMHLDAFTQKGNDSVNIHRSILREKLNEIMFK